MAVCAFPLLPPPPPIHQIILTTSPSTRSRTIRNSYSARVSVPSLLREEEDPEDPSKPWVWRTNLAETKPFWENWFVGLSKKFLEARGGKLLLLAGTDRLDKELMIGQMQGELPTQPAQCLLCPYLLSSISRFFHCFCIC